MKQTTAIGLNDPITHHPVVSHADWLAARKELLKQEKELTRLCDRVNEARRALPWEKVETNYIFEPMTGYPPTAPISMPTMASPSPRSRWPPEMSVITTAPQNQEVRIRPCRMVGSRLAARPDAEMSRLLRGLRGAGKRDRAVTAGGGVRQVGTDRGLCPGAGPSGS